MNAWRYEAERLFYSKLDENLFSCDVIRGNRFTDIIFVTAVKTGHSIKVYFDFLSFKVSFYTVDDDEIVYSLDIEGINELYDKLMNEISTTYFVEVFNENMSIRTLCGTIFPPEEAEIMKNLKKITQNVGERFDEIIVTNFFGTYRRQFKFLHGRFE